MAFVDNILITGFQFVYQLVFKGTFAIPGLTCGHFSDVDFGSVLRNKILKQRVYVFKLFDKFLPTFFRILAKHGEGAFMLAGGEDFDVDIFAFQQPMEIWWCLP